MQENGFSQESNFSWFNPDKVRQQPGNTELATLILSASWTLRDSARDISAGTPTVEYYHELAGLLEEIASLLRAYSTFTGQACLGVPTKKSRHNG